MTLDEFDDIKTRLDAAELPDGERVILQTRPDWWRLALSAYHLKAIGLYFAVFALWRLGSTIHDTGSTALGVERLLGMLPAFGFGIALLMLLAWLTARATSFTLTDRRLVMRFGVALPSQLNIPLKDIDAAGMHLHADGSADIPVSLPEGAKGRPSYFQLWPYARPMKLVAAEPMLRAVPEGEKVARLLAETLMTLQGGERHVVSSAAKRGSAPPAGQGSTSKGVTGQTAAA